jgi:hypothetical protein
LMVARRRDNAMNNRINPTPMSESKPGAHTGLRPVHVIAATFVFLVAGLACWTFQMGSKPSDLNAATGRVCSVSMALVNYSEIHGHLPEPVIRQQPVAQRAEARSPTDAGEPLYSWRVAIVPYLERWHGAWDPSQPWDHLANRELAELSPFYAFGASQLRGHRQLFPETNLVAITGPGTAFCGDDGRPMALKAVPPATILAAESRSSGIPWPAPGDLDIRTMPQTVGAASGEGICGRNSGGFHVIFADGWVWLLSDKVPFPTLSKFFTTADAKKHDREQLLGPFVLHRGP